MQEIESTD